MERIAIHYVILNWNEKAFTIIETIALGRLGRETINHLLTNNDKSVLFLRGTSTKKCFVVRRQPVKPDWSKTGHVQKAKSVIITSWRYERRSG